MKVIKLLTVILVVLGIGFLSFSCSSDDSSSTAAKATNYTVKTGTLSVSITGTGNLAYSKTEDLAFELDGYVASVLVEEGDTVTEGQELATLDTSDWKDQINTLERKVTSVKRQVADAERTVESKQLAVNQAELDLASAEYNLGEIAEVKTANNKIDDYEKQIDYVENLIKDPATDSGDIGEYRDELDNLRVKLEAAYKSLNTILGTSDTGISKTDNVSITSKVNLTIAQDVLKVNQSKADLENAKTAVDNAKLDLEDAQLDLQEAQDNLQEAKDESPIITAPFDGYITKVNVNGGDEVYKGKVAVVIADPTQFEADILVAESDIYSVKLGGEATVSIDALEDVTFPAEITFISPTASVSSGVVNYDVVVTLTSLTPISTTSQTASGNTSSGQMTAPNGLPSGTFPSGDFSGFPKGTPPEGFPDRSASNSGSTVSTNTDSNTATTESVTLMDGLSATVEIISEQATDAIIVPSKALTKQGGSYTVQVVNGTSTETRTVKTGLTDGTSTVVTSGLTAGEVITYGGKTTASSASTTTTTARSGGGGLVPGIGGGGGGRPPGGF